MYRLIIVDDERIIRESISKCINWNEIDIEVIGVCKNGIEAYDMIVDTHPDIVLTDIEMPVLSGLKLIEKVNELNLSTEFVILSGYSDFTFATQAMKYGIQHYLLKPCSPEEIISTMQDVIAKCKQKHTYIQLETQHKELISLYEENIISNTIIATLSNKQSFQDVMNSSSNYIDVYSVPYIQYEFYNISEESKEFLLKHLSYYYHLEKSQTLLFCIYTTDKITIFYKSEPIYDEFASFIKILNSPWVFNLITFTYEYKITTHTCLNTLLNSVVKSFKPYNLVYFVYNDNHVPICNYPTIGEKYVNQLNDMRMNKLNKIEIDALLKHTLEIDNLTLAKSLISNYILQNYFDNKIISTTNKIIEVTTTLNQYQTASELYDYLKHIIDNYYDDKTSPLVCKDFIQRIINYINTNYSDSHLTLKWIAENYLYMNVDYVSKQFSKQIGIRFSTYLAQVRIEKAKKLLLEQGSDRIYDIAELTGFGNNPQYFSQTFKKHTRMTPTEFINTINGYDANTYTH